MLEYAWLIPVFPFVAFLLIAMLPKKTLFWEDGAVYGIAGAFGALALSVLVIWEVLMGETLTVDAPRTTWLIIGDFQIEFGIWIDQLTAVMLLVVSVVGTLVVIYSGGYMHEEGEGRRRYYAEIMLFISVMYGLVISRQLPPDVHLLGARRPVLVPAHRLLVRRSPPPRAPRSARSS